MSAIIIVTVLAILAVAGVTATAIVTMRDGYHQIPNRRA